MRDDDDTGLVTRSHVAKLPWSVIWMTLLVAALLGTLVYLACRDVYGYRHACHVRGGHVVEVKDVEICLDGEDKVIFL